MDFYWLILGILSVWRITHLIQAEDGPWDIIVRIRRLAGRSVFGKLMDCFYCLSLWIAIPFAYAIGYGWKQWILLELSLSAGAILLEKITNKQPENLPVHYTEEEEK